LVTAPDELLQSVLADTENDEPRLAYAAWCDDCGDPRGEFIRAQVEWFGLDAGDRKQELYKRFNSLFAAHGSEWLAPLEPVVGGLKMAKLGIYSFRRGFVTVVNMQIEDFVSTAPALMALAPIAALATYPGDNRVRNLAKTPEAGRLRFLAISRADLGDPGAMALAESPFLRDLDSLKLSGNAITSEGAEALGQSAALRTIRRLELRANPLGTRGVQGLLGAGEATIELLDLSGCAIGPEGGEALAASPRLGQVVDLRLASFIEPAFPRSRPRLNDLGDDGATGLASCELPQLVRLDLEATRIGDAGAAELAIASFGRLEVLNLRQNEIGEEGTRALQSSTSLSALKTLDLDGQI
jgi:uncharacterized protein (TIGR02996 family)